MSIPEVFIPEAELPHVIVPFPLYITVHVDLANQGYTAEEILKYYYGDDIYLLESTASEEIKGTFPGKPLSLGDSGVDVLRMQHSINRLNDNFPLIPNIEITGFYDENTENAVKVFQEVFGLPVTGIVDSETWYKIRYIYVAVTGLDELASEGLLTEDLRQLYSNIVLEGGNLPVTGIVDEATWNRLSQVYQSLLQTASHIS
jgi:hypothetical protein